MKYTITYIDSSGAMMDANNPTEYDSEVEGIISLIAPKLKNGEFRGWYKDSTLTNRIDQLSDELGEDSDVTIYAYIVVISQLDILGSSINEIYNFSTNPYILLTSSIDANSHRSLIAMSPGTFTGFISGAVRYLHASNSSISAYLETVKQEYYIDVGNQNNLQINIMHPESADCILLHLTRGSDITLNNIGLDIIVSGITINNKGTQEYLGIPIGSTIIYQNSDQGWRDSIFINPTLSSISGLLINESLKVRNYSYSGILSFPADAEPSSVDDKLSLKVKLNDLDLAGLADLGYKAVFIQFDTLAYSGKLPEEIKILNQKQGYLNLIDVQPSTLTYNSTTRSSELRLTYDYIPAYESDSLKDYTEDIPIKIMVVL